MESRQYWRIALLLWPHLDNDSGSELLDNVLTHVLTRVLTRQVWAVGAGEAGVQGGAGL